MMQTKVTCKYLLVFSLVHKDFIGISQHMIHVFHHEERTFLCKGIHAIFIDLLEYTCEWFYGHVTRSTDASL